MTVHFAAARSPLRSPVARVLYRRALREPANDNLCGGQDHMLHAALRHFAAHGLRAAERARQSAEQAFFVGDREAYQWWRGICYALDRPMARELGLMPEVVAFDPVI